MQNRAPETIRSPHAGHDCGVAAPQWMQNRAAGVVTPQETQMISAPALTPPRH
jgi:hypothetical protein